MLTLPKCLKEFFFGFRREAQHDIYNYRYSHLLFKDS